MVSAFIVFPYHTGGGKINTYTSIATELQNKKKKHGQIRKQNHRHGVMTLTLHPKIECLIEKQKLKQNFNFMTLVKFLE